MQLSGEIESEMRSLLICPKYYGIDLITASHPQLCYVTDCLLTELLNALFFDKEDETCIINLVLPIGSCVLYDNNTRQILFHLFIVVFYSVYLDIFNSHFIQSN